MQIRNNNNDYEAPTIIINNHEIFEMIRFVRETVGTVGAVGAVAHRKLIINLKMLINLITVFIFIALPQTSQRVIIVVVDFVVVVAFRFVSKFWQFSLCIVFFSLPIYILL